MAKVKCLVVDDSAIYRSHIKRVIEKAPYLELVGQAEEGLAGVQMALDLRPDIVILDLEMPKCDGLETLKKLNAQGFSGDVILFASPNLKTAQITMEALELGARDFIAKPSYEDQSQGGSPHENIKEALLPKIRGLLDQSQLRSSRPVTASQNSYSKANWKIFAPKIVVIGSSTGGPTALDQLFRFLKPPFSVPIVITQHMPPVFTTSFAERMGKVVGISSFEVSDDMLIQPNHIYIARGGIHMKLVKEGLKVKTKLFDGPDINFIKPAVDPLFVSAAHIYKSRCLGLVLTGMGQDGYKGAIQIKNKGGCVLIQDKKSSTVWGMPSAVYNEGCFDECLNLQGLAQKLNEKISLSYKSEIRGAP